MSSVTAKIYSILSADAALQALIGGKCYPNKAAEGVTGPHVVYTVISDVPQNVIDGASPTLRRARVQVDCYALHLDNAVAVADAVAELLLRTEVGFASAELDREEGYDDEAQYHRVRMDYSMWRNV